jgi:23S rRNA (adenine2503-C2)-methyltransferase
MGVERQNTALFGMSLVELQALMVELGSPKYRGAQVFEALYRGRVSLIEEMTVLPLALREQLVAAGYSVGRPEMVQTAKSVDGTERYLMRMGDGETVETVWMPEGDGGERGDGSEAASEEADEVDLIEVGGEASRPKLKPEAGAARDGVAGPSTASGAKDAPDSAQDDDIPIARRKRFQDVGTLEKNGYRRATICISSQVGCAVNCQFCLTAKLEPQRPPPDPTMHHNVPAGETGRRR